MYKRLEGIVIKGLCTAIRGYQTLISPHKHTPSCRFLPSCSAYAIEALQTHGLIKGSWLALRRISRCHPLGGSGIDEVPPVNKPQK